MKKNMDSGLVNPEHLKNVRLLKRMGKKAIETRSSAEFKKYGEQSSLIFSAAIAIVTFEKLFKEHVGATRKNQTKTKK